MRDLIFVDTESTGLADDPDAEIVELTWARLDGEPHTLWFGVQHVPEFIDDLIGFTARGLAGRASTYPEFANFLADADDATMIAANPSHDKHFIKKAGLWVFHYRMLDIESYAMAKLGLPTMPGMKDIFNILSNGHKITQPDHTSRNDVLAMRDAFKVLKEL